MSNYRIERITKTMVLLMVLIVIFQKKSMSAGLSTKFADIILSGLRPGMVYSMKQEQNLGFKVMNSASGAIEVEVVIEPPNKSNLREGYIAIPDPGWIRITPQRFILQSGELSDCDIVLSIPDKEEYLNKHFQASIITQTVTKPSSKGVAISIALQSRFRFSTGPTPAAVMDEYRKKVLEALNLDVAPLSLYLSDVAVGEVIEMGKDDYETLQIVNRSKQSYKVEFKKPGEMLSYGISSGYSPAPDTSWLKFKKKRVKVKPKKIQDIRMKLTIPDKEEYRGKSYAFIVVGNVQGFDLPIQVYGRVYVKTRK